MNSNLKLVCIKTMPRSDSSSFIKFSFNPINHHHQPDQMNLETNFDFCLDLDLPSFHLIYLREFYLNLINSIEYMFERYQFVCPIRSYVKDYHQVCLIELL